MNRKPGFTLIEMIVALALLGIVGVTFASAMSYTARSYLASAESVEIAQKARLAMTRIFIELQEMRDVDAANRGDADANAFYYLDGEGTALALVRSGSSITLGGDTLLDGVASTGSLLTYLKDDGSAWNPASGNFSDLYEIGVNVVMSSSYLGQNRSFTTTVNPLYTGVARAPRLQ